MSASEHLQSAIQHSNDQQFGNEDNHQPDYHLIDRPTGFTVCGLNASTVPLKWKAALSWTPAQLLEKTICEDCVRLSEPETAD